MANAIGQRSSTIGSFNGMTGYLYVYTRADGRVVTRYHPNTPPSTPEWPSHQEPEPEWSHQGSDSNGVEEQEGEHRNEERTEENKSVFWL
jgi:hypothetical protein